MSTENKQGVMTTEQIYHRRLARKEVSKLPAAITQFINWADPDNRGKGSPYQIAKSAAWHAFHAHPELRADSKKGMR